MAIPAEPDPAQAGEEPRERIGAKSAAAIADALRQRRCGVLLAAGHARRAGGVAKLALPWPPVDGAAPGTASSTIIASTFDALARWCGHMVVVVGGHRTAVRAALGDRLQAPTVHQVDGDPDAEMFDSVRRGLAAVARVAPTATVALLCPGDCVGACRVPIGRLLSLVDAAPSSAVMFEHGGRGGHPVAIPTGLIGGILGWRGEEGLGGYWASHPEEHVRLALDDPGIVADIDTLADYDAAQVVHRPSTDRGPYECG